MKTTYQVWDKLWNDYMIFQSEAAARDWIKETVDSHLGSNYTDFVIYKREELPNVV